MGYQEYKDRQSFFQELQADRPNQLDVFQELQADQLDTKLQNPSLFNPGAMHRIGLVHGSELEYSNTHILEILDTTSMALTRCLGSKLHKQIAANEETLHREKPTLFNWQKSISLTDNSLPTIIEFMIANSEVLVPNSPNTPLYSTIILANSAVNHISQNANTITHSMILGNYKQLDSLQTIGAPLLSNDPSIHQLDSNSPSTAVWNYITHNPWATSKFRHGAMTQRYQYALTQLKRDLEYNLRVNDQSMIIAGKIPNAYYPKLHQHIKGTAVATAITHNSMYPNQTPIPILADSHTWQAFIEQFSQMHNIDPENMEVYYDQEARKQFTNLITS